MTIGRQAKSPFNGSDRASVSPDEGCSVTRWGAAERIDRPVCATDAVMAIVNVYIVVAATDYDASACAIWVNGSVH